MGLVRSFDEIARLAEDFSKGYVLGDVVMAMVMFRTKADVVKKVLPPPLEPDPDSTGLAYVAEFHKFNFGVTYNEAALFLSAQYKGEMGNYCLSMPVTNDMAMMGGREMGFPKKIAEKISVERRENTVTGVCIRKGIPIITIKTDLTGPAGPDAIPQMKPNFLFKHFKDPEQMNTFDRKTRLLKQQNQINWGKVEVGKGELVLAKSEYDPIYEIPIEEVLTAVYAKGLEIRMELGQIIAEVDPIEFMPYSFINNDWPL